MPESRSEVAEVDVFVTVRIPANWGGAEEMVEKMSAGCQLLPHRFISEEGMECQLTLRDADDEFAKVFAMSCRREPTEEEKQAIENYRVQVCLTGRCGSRKSAYMFMRAIEHWLDAGGTGVFLDNSGVAFGRQGWREVMEQIDAEQLNADALTFAYVGVCRGAVSCTVGMQILGCPDVEMSSDQVGADGFEIIEMMQYVCEADELLKTGDLAGDEHAARFLVSRVEDPQPPGHPMHNPFGRIRLTSLRDIADSN